MTTSRRLLRRQGARNLIVVPLLLAACIVWPGWPRWPALGARPAIAEHFLPSECEGRAGDLYETLGPASFEKLGERYTLTVRCDGVHQIYARGSSRVNLEPFLRKPVRARYRYVDEENLRTRCIRAPCPPSTERMVEIVEVEVVTGPDTPRQ